MNFITIPFIQPGFPDFPGATGTLIYAKIVKNNKKMFVVRIISKAVFTQLDGYIGTRGV